MANEPLNQEIFCYFFDGKEYSYRVDELEDGFWLIFCNHDLFRIVNGSNTIQKANSVTEALQDLAKTHQSLADAMLEPFVKKCKLSIEAYSSWVRDRRTFYHLN
jgi:hypothetical protein